MKIDRQALRFALILLPVGIASSLYLGLANEDLMRSQGFAGPTVVIVLLSMLQVAVVYTFGLGYIGHRLATRVSLMRPLRFGHRTTVVALMSGFAGALIMLSDLFVFAPHIPQIAAAYSEGSFNPWGLLFAMLYGGVIEEIMLRLFFLSLLVFFFDLLGKRSKRELPIPAWWYHVANLVAALLFALGHLPATQVAFGELTALLVIRSLVLNGVLGYLFGWLYIRKGIQYAMLAHATTHLFNQALLHLFIL